MKIIVGPLESKIETDNKELLDTLVELYSVPIPGAKYTQAYKRGHWKGQKAFISKEGTFKSGLLPRVLEDLKKIECFPQILENVDTKFQVSTIININGWTFHDYQEEAIKKILQVGRGVLRAPTGSGKTLILAGLLKAFEGKKVLCLFNQKQLIHQTYKFLTEKPPKGVALPKLGNFKIGVCFSEGYDYQDIMLCSVFSIERLIGTPMEFPDVLIVDECHEFCTGKFTSEVISAFPTAHYRIGLTATVPKEKYPLYNLEGGLGPEIVTVSTKELIEEKKLAEPLIQLIPLKCTNNDYEDKSYPWVYEKYIINNSVRNNIIKTIIESIYKNNQKAKVLVLVKNLEHGDILRNLIPESEYLQGSDDLATRGKAISKFQTTQKSRTLIGTRILQTGANIPEITHFINAAALDSDIVTIQSLGRALRITPEVQSVKIYDFIDKVRYLEKHSNARRKAYKREGHKIEILPTVTYDNP